MEYLIEHKIYESLGVIGPLLPLSSVPVLPDDVDFKPLSGDDHITDDFGHSAFALAGCEVLEHDTIAGVYGRRDPWDRRSLGPLHPQEQLNYRPEYPLLTLFGMPCMD
ncbi:hypothetical protein QCA50_008045 [Cerrena zonata]|uniref:Uncharacterized protein n=1 Tax=Cerrena zonata TaxID=2478898 RepID=A0AAW0G7V5_9APHY